MTEIFEFEFGEFNCTVFQDIQAEQSANQIFGSVDESERSQAISNSPYNPDAIQLSMNIMLLERDGQRILLDTGNTANDPENARLFPLLAEANISANSIDVVALTHAHADHYSGMLDAKAKKIFPNARYVIWQAEWEHYSSDEQMEREREKAQERYDYIDHYFRKLAPHLEFLTPENNELALGIRALPAYGHTKYHVRYEITSQNKTMHYLGDAYLHPLNIDNPHWTFPFEYDDAIAIATRQELRDKFADSDDLVFVYHFEFPGLGYIKYEKNYYVWEAVSE